MRHYIFAGFSYPSSADLARWAGLGVCGVIVGLNNQDNDSRGVEAVDLQDGFAWLVGDGRAKLHRCMEECAKLGLLCLPMIWARPAERYNAEASEALEEFLGLPAFGGLVHDLEVYWHKLIRPAGLRPASAAELWARYWERDGLVNLPTDYASLPSASLEIVRRSGHGIPQAYSRHSWFARGGGQNAVWKPGRTQDTAGKTWGKAALMENLWCGLACYDQGPDPRAWMLAQVQGAHAAGFGAVAWWSAPAARGFQGQSIERAWLGLLEDLRAGKVAL